MNVLEKTKPNNESNQTTMNESESYSARAFKPLGEYDWPTMPAEHVVRRYLDRFKDLFDKHSDEPSIKQDQLNRTSQDRRDDVTTPPACGPLLSDFTASIDSWIHDSERTSNTRLFVMPPCQQSNLLEMWAKQYHHEILESPARDKLLSEEPNITTVEGDGILVIPDLSHWFLRHRCGLTTMRALVALLSTTERVCVVGCNSWAWSYLCRAIKAHQILTYGQVFQAFDDQRLRDWFADLAECSDEPQTKFRHVESGADVLATDSDGQPKCDYLTTLAAHSMGIPWVAWHIWRRSLRTMPPAESTSTSKSVPKPGDDDKDTLWLVDYPKYVLADRQLESSLLILHALLIHGTLTRDNLDWVLPWESGGHSVNALLHQGFVDEAAGQLFCNCAAYPAVRQYLTDAGFPVDEL